MAGTVAGIAVQAERTAGQARVIAGQFLQPVDVAPPGHAIRVAWAGVSGASSVEVESASARIGPAVVQEPLGELTVKSEGRHRRLTIPGGKRVSKLKLEGLEAKVDGSWTGLTAASHLSESGPRLVVSIEDPAAGWIPLHAVPPVPARGVLPPMFGGANFSNRVLSLPGEAAAGKLRLSVVKNPFPEDFEVLEMRLDRAFGWARLPPRDLELAGPDEGVVWAFPGELPPEAPAVEVDLRVAFETALNAALAAGEPLDLVYRLRGAPPGEAGFSFARARGSVVRAFPGVLRAVLEGDPTGLDLGAALGGQPLSEERPTSVTADLSVRYEGVRVLETLSDPVPAPGGANGQVVGEKPLTRGLPPAALHGLPLVRAGLIGRAPEASELSVQVVDMTTGEPGGQLGPPGTIELQPSASLGTVWVEVPEFEAQNGPVGVSVRANRGRFFWAGGPAGPLLKLAVRDPDPGGRPLKLNGHQLLSVVGAERFLPLEALPAEAFQSRIPMLESDLFLTVDLADLTLRYRR